MNCYNSFYINLLYRIIFLAGGFDVEKIEAVLFTIVRKNLLIKLAEDNKLSIGGKKIKFSVNVIKWLGIILDSGFKLKAYVD